MLIVASTNPNTGVQAKTKTPDNNSTPKPIQNHHQKQILAEIGDLRRNVEADLAACQKALDEEAAADAAARSEHGADRWPVPVSATLARHLLDKIQSYRSTLAQAGESDAKVIARLNENESAFAALTPAAAAAQLPRLSAPLVAVGPDDPAVAAAALRRSLEALNALSAERAGIEEALKELKAKDNILPKLMASPSSAYDALFASELGKYSKLREDASASAARNDEALARLGREAAAFRAAFQVPQWRAACEAAAGGVRGALKAYREVLDHLSEGLRFYMSLQEAVKEHQQQCSDFAFTRALQRDELRQDAARRAREAAAGAAAAAAAAAGIGAMGFGAAHSQQQHPQQQPPGGYGAYGAPPHGAYGAPPPPPQVQAPYHGTYAGAAPPPPQAGYWQGPPPPGPQHAQQPPHGYPPPQQQYQYPQYPPR